MVKKGKDDAASKKRMVGSSDERWPYCTGLSEGIKWAGLRRRELVCEGKKEDEK
ncbi:hypothetical protein TWF718_010109 [Orbilia javanica]|uniref:Uncharacterized protein n=1 Tax=Orbilia javanica TaxID=47235 RepID=A0AAN8RDK8_9PEZI